MNDLERLLAEREITRLVLRYAQLNDAGDFDGLAALFAENGQFVRPSGGAPVTGRAAILASYKERPPRISRHLITNILPEIVDEKTATCASTILLYSAPAGDLPANAAGPALLGGFNDRLIKTSEGWRFLERRGYLDLKIGA